MSSPIGPPSDSRHRPTNHAADGWLGPDVFMDPDPPIEPPSDADLPDNLRRAMDDLWSGGPASPIEPPSESVRVDRCEMCGDVAVVRMILADGAPMWMCRDCADLRYLETFDVE